MRYGEGPRQMQGGATPAGGRVTHRGTGPARPGSRPRPVAASRGTRVYDGPRAAGRQPPLHTHALTRAHARTMRLLRCWPAGARRSPAKPMCLAYVLRT
jgi:hypothetical protein